MHIPSYQIHNVLKVYSKQVSQSRVLERQKDLTEKPSVDKINISNEGKRKVIIDKVAAGIVDKITRFGPEDQVESSGAYAAEGETAKSVETVTKNQKDFVYNIIDDQNNKKTNTLSIDGSNFVTQQMSKPAEEEN
jgi:hypothetical protein